MAADKAKEAVKHRNKQKFSLEVERTIEDNKKLGYALTNILGNVSNLDDVDPHAMSIMQGIRRDIILDIEYIKRVESLLKIGGGADG